MRNLKTYMSLLFMGALALTSCQDDFDDPAQVDPTSTWLTDTDRYEIKTINEIKTTYWQAGDNYYTTIGEGTDGKHLLVKGHIISSDASGNIYKSLVIQDATGALAMSVNANSMNVKYRRGQEMVIDLTGMTIGKYSGLEQLGFPEESAQYGQQTTFMPYEFFQEHIQLNGMPELAKVDTLVVKGAEITGGGDANLIKWQSQLVRFNNCHFEEAGKEPFGIEKENTNRVLITEDNTKINVRTSGYSNFYTDILPKGNGDVVGILGYYAGSSDTGNNWQLTLIDRNGCMNFGNPTVGPGAENNPYTVDEAISVMAGNGTATQVWTTGYIVGAVAPFVTEVTKNEDIQFTATPELDNTLVIASTPDCKDWSKCMVISLPQGSKLREYGNLVDHKENYGKQIWLIGNFAKVLGTYGITGNNGTPSEFRIDGVEIPGDEPTPPAGDGDGTEANPYSVSQIIAKGTDFTQTGVYIKGYIVGAVNDKSWTAASTEWAAPFTLNTNILIADSPTENDWTKCVAVQLPSGSVRDGLNLVANPGNLGKQATLLGNVEKYFGKPGFKGVTSFTLDGQGTDPNPPTPPVTGGDGTETSPFSVADIIAKGTSFTQTGAYVKGYIVGAIGDKSWTAESSEWAAPFTLKTNVMIADSPTEKDWTKCVPVQLPAGTVRDELNLVDHPENLGKQVTLGGNVEKYFGKPGFKGVTSYTLDGQGTGGDTPEPPTPPVSGGDGTEASPYSPTEIITLGTSYTQTGAYVTGYIVGAIGDKSWSAESSEWAAPFTLKTNLMIAASADEKDWTKCVPVQLPAGTVRDELNLVDHPENLGKQVTLTGNVEKYFGKPGFKGVTSYKF